jgi:hypothetical protein
MIYVRGHVKDGAVAVTTDLDTDKGFVLLQ